MFDCAIVKNPSVKTPASHRVSSSFVRRMVDVAARIQRHLPAKSLSSSVLLPHCRPPMRVLDRWVARASTGRPSERAARATGAGTQSGSVDEAARRMIGMLRAR
jgi:hypothetical protein